jgi:hypothetical protein
MAADTTLTPNPGMHVGVNVKPGQYETWYPKFTTPPAETRVFFPPGSGLYQLGAKTISSLPAGCHPWISHKDPVPVADIGAYWTKLIDKVQPAPGRVLKWTYCHEGEDSDHSAYVAYWRDLRRMWEDHPQQQQI